MFFEKDASPSQESFDPHKSSLIKRQTLKAPIALENLDFTANKTPHSSESLTFEEILEILHTERTRNSKLELKLQEKERIIEQLQEFNRKIRVDYEKNQKELLLLIEEKNRCIEFKCLQLERFEKARENNESKGDISPLSKSKSPCEMSTKSSCKNGGVYKSCKSQRSINFDACSSQGFECSKKNAQTLREILNYNQEKEQNQKIFEQRKSREYLDNLQENAQIFHGFLEELFSKILKLLGLSYLDEILPKLKGLLEKLKIYEQFHECLGKVIMDCSPEGLWKDFPSVKQQWKWVKNVMTEYMNLKKNEKKFAMSMSQFISPKLTQRLCDENTKP